MTGKQPDADVVRKAASLIRERGLAQYALIQEGRLCFTGAVLMAQGGPEAEKITDEAGDNLWGFGFDNSPVLQNQLRRIQLRAGDILKQRRLTLAPGLEVVNWNNQSGRTANEVADLLDEVATRL